MRTIKTLGGKFCLQHRWLLAAARFCGVGLCGGCAAAITNSNSAYVPKDIDFVATREDAERFVSLICHFFLNRSVHFRIYGNSQNKFVPSAAIAHFRITCPFWLPICIFVIPDDALKMYRIKGGHFLQIYADVKKAADELTEIDQKPRIANEEEIVAEHDQKYYTSNTKIA